MLDSTNVVSVAADHDDEEVKVCRDCGKAKPISQFWKSKRHQGGHNTRCVECFIIRRDNRYYTPKLRSLLERTETLDRSNKKNFISYALNNPIYFKTIFGCEATESNAAGEYDYIMNNPSFMGGRYDA